MTAEVLQVKNKNTVVAWPFAAARKIGSTVYVGLRITRSATSGTDQEIEDQTHYVFQDLIKALESQGAKMSDLMKLHTYYIYEGDGAAVTEYWERMTAVRLQYLANPGPAATALRVSGLGQRGALIGVDGIGDPTAERTRIMPEHAWDWSVPTPFSQGWLVNDKVYVGGQISADRSGKAVDPNRIEPQTKNTLEFIRHVLLDSGATWEDVVSIKVAYKCDEDADASRERLAQILSEMNQVFPNRKPALVCFGVDLLYEGLLLEIDATAVKGGNKSIVKPGGCETWAGASLGYAPAWLAGNELYIGGQSAPGGASLTAQAESTMTRIGNILAEAGSDYTDLVKLNVYYTSDAQDGGSVSDLEVLTGVLESFLAPERTVVSVIEVPGLMHPGQRIQIDGFAVLNQGQP